jgi:hypothetical protein
MATQPNSFESFDTDAGRGGYAGARARRGKPDPYGLRPLPNEEIYFYRKAIDNSRVMRQADPQARRHCWRWIATTAAGTMLLAAMLWPNLYGMVAGYQVESLKIEQQRLLAERASLELAEARQLSPDRLEELARQQDFIDPAPAQVVYLPPTADGSLAALNARSK